MVFFFLIPNLLFHNWNLIIPKTKEKGSFHFKDWTEKKKKKRLLAKLLTTGRDYQCDLTVKKGKV